MAGAISAGAYTAGVIDYLLESLENWEKAKKLQKDGKISGIPKHNVVIDVLSGASAGGMTAILTSALINNKFEHVRKKDIENDNNSILEQNPLYNSWVNLTEKNGHDMMSAMLSTDDIDNNKEVNPQKEVKSLFNSNFIKTIAIRHINNVKRDTEIRRPYFDKNLEVVATLTNLRGIPFEIQFNTKSYSRLHRMKRHFDIAHFQLNPSEKYNKDGRIPFHFENDEGYNKDILVQSAMATGGFPIGLEPRIIKRLGKYIVDNKYLNLGNRSNLHTINNDDIFETLNVDGGTINNDPFELTQRLLDEKLKTTEEERKITAKDFESTVLMIDPFPNHNKLPEVNYYPLKAFKFIVPKIVSSMLDELRMKENVLKSAYGGDDYTRFLIMPTRSGANREKENHIACGSMGGFGGFFSKEFRKHDFLLGRRNCQQFLKKYFSVPVDAKNSIIDFGYTGITESFQVDVKNVKYLPIIPDIRVVYNILTESYELEKQENFTEDRFKYSEIKLSYLLGLKKSLKNRISVLIENITNGKEPGTEKIQNDVVKQIRKKSWFKKALSVAAVKPITNTFLWLAKTRVRGILADKFIDIVIEDMDNNELLTNDVK